MDKDHRILEWRARVNHSGEIAATLSWDCHCVSHPTHVGLRRQSEIGCVRLQWCAMLYRCGDFEYMFFEVEVQWINQSLSQGGTDSGTSVSMFLLALGRLTSSSPEPALYMFALRIISKTHVKCFQSVAGNLDVFEPRYGISLSSRTLQSMQETLRTWHATVADRENRLYQTVLRSLRETMYSKPWGDVC